MRKNIASGIWTRLVFMLMFAGMGGHIGLYAQTAHLSLNGGLAHNNNVNVGTIGVDLRYLFSERYVVGIRVNTALQVPTRIERIVNGNAELHRLDGVSTVNTMMADIGLRQAIGPVDILGGVSIGGTNVAHQRMYPNNRFSLLGSGGGTTESAPSLAVGAWLTTQIHVFDGWHIGVGASLDFSENVRPTASNHETGAEYQAVFGGRQVRGVVSIGKDLGRPDISDTTHHHWWLLLSTRSLHPFSEYEYNEFNPGVGVHVRFKPGQWTWFGEAGVYQFSLADRATYAGAGLYYNIAGDWLKAGVLAGALLLNYADGLGFTPALSPRITADSPIGSVTVLFIPVWTESAFGLTLHLPLF